MTPRLTIASSCSWSGFYLDDRLIQEDEDIDIHLLLHKLGIKYDRVSIEEDVIDRFGGLPFDLDDLKGLDS